MTERSQRPGDAQSWGPSEDGKIRAHQVQGWQMAAVLRSCLLRIGAEPETDGGNPLAVNFALTADQADEIGRGLCEIARRLRAESASLQ